MTIERKEHTISLRQAFNKPSSVKRPNGMIRLIFKYMAKHFRQKPQNVIIDPEVNAAIWNNSKSSLPRQLSVDVVTKDGLYYVFLRGSKKAELVGKAKEAPKAAAKVEKVESKEEEKTEKVVDKKEKKALTEKKKIVKEGRPRIAEEH